MPCPPMLLSPLQSWTDKRGKHPRAAVDACIVFAINDDTATATKTIPCAATTSTPATAVNDSDVDALLVSTHDAAAATLPLFME